VRVSGVDAEVVCIDRSEQRVVGVRVALAPCLKRLEPRVHARGRELKTVIGHVAVGAGTAVPIQAFEAAVKKRVETTGDRVAAPLRALERPLARVIRRLRAKSGRRWPQRHHQQHCASRK
jgi:hypothetical protein